MTRGRSRPRAILTKNQVISIFGCKSSSHRAAVLAQTFGVSEKAIRDVWTGRTWAAATLHLDITRALKQKQVGRPKGSKDKRPRQRRDAAETGTTKLEPKEIHNSATDGIRASHANHLPRTSTPAEAISTQKEQQCADLENLPLSSTLLMKDCPQTRNSSVVDVQMHVWEDELNVLTEDPFAEDLEQVFSLFQVLINGQNLPADANSRRS